MDGSDAQAIFSALAQPTRLAALRLLVSRGPGGVAAGELAALVDVPQNTLSAHLAVLARAGLVSGERRGRMIRYRAEVERLRAVGRFLLDDCCGGRPGLCAPASPLSTPPTSEASGYV